ncbi:hypothetical protein FQA39_LY13470 [Lamprigera yunnana]|nr:hypothetical protein FQA39_LY13470 [Lamprigera yunnana]
MFSKFDFIISSDPYVFCCAETENEANFSPLRTDVRSRDFQRTAEWQKNCGNSNVVLMDISELSNKLICEKHFIPTDININNKRKLLNKNAVPVKYIEPIISVQEPVCFVFNLIALKKIYAGQIRESDHSMVQADASEETELIDFWRSGRWLPIWRSSGGFLFESAMVNYYLPVIGRKYAVRSDIMKCKTNCNYDIFNYAYPACQYLYSKLDYCYMTI